MRTVTALICLLLGLAAICRADEAKHQITGLFSTDREADLREVFAKITEAKLVSIDFKNSEVVLDYEAAKAFPKMKPEQIVQRLDALVKAASNHTFGVKPLRAAAADKLKLVEIPVVGLDCKACCLAAYESINRIDGVEMATASFREGRVTALIDPTKTNRAVLEAALKKRGVEIAKEPRVE